MMRVLLIQVARADGQGQLHRPGRLWFHGLTLPYLAALFSPRCEVQVVDELIDALRADHQARLLERETAA